MFWSPREASETAPRARYRCGLDQALIRKAEVTVLTNDHVSTSVLVRLSNESPLRGNGFGRTTTRGRNGT